MDLFFKDKLKADEFTEYLETKLQPQNAAVTHVRWTRKDQ
jgi:hypothetical protein